MVGDRFPGSQENGKWERAPCSEEILLRAQIPLEKSTIEKRQYVRMNTVFPVEVARYRENANVPDSPLLQGFTRDISAGGMCIEVKSLHQEIEDWVREPDLHLSLSIDPPFARSPIRAVARMAWHKKQGEL